MLQSRGREPSGLGSYASGMPKAPGQLRGEQPPGTASASLTSTITRTVPARDPCDLSGLTGHLDVTGSTTGLNKVDLGDESELLPHPDRRRLVPQ
jgi:hypothetical protein